MDKILIRGLTVHSLIGVFPEERHAPQRLILDLDLTFDLSQAGRSDDVNDTINYASVCEGLSKIAESTQYQLLEALADEMLNYVLAEYPCSQVKMVMNKPDIMPNGTNVAIELVRAR